MLIEAIKLPIEWHRFGYTHTIVKHPSFRLLGKALHCLPAVKREHMKWPPKATGCRTRWGGQGAPYWNSGREGHFGRMSTTARESSKGRRSWANSPERAERLSSASKLSVPREGWQRVCFCHVQGNRLCVNSFQLETGCTNTCNCLYSPFPS